MAENTEIDLLRGESLPVPKAERMTFLYTTDIANKAILGIEGIIITPQGKHHPNINEIADFSALSGDIEKSHTAARDFLKIMMKEGESDSYVFITSNAT